MSSTSASAWLSSWVIAVACAYAPAEPLTSQQNQCVAKAKRFERNGWIYLHIEGEAKERGFQHGYLLAPEIVAGLKTTALAWEHRTGMTWPWLVERTGAMFA